MNIPAQSVPVSKKKWPHSLIIRTTLYDLIGALNAQVSPDDDDLAIAAVVHLLKTHALTYVRPSKPRRSVTDQSRRMRHHRHTAASPERSERIRAVRVGLGLPGLGLLPGPCPRSPIRCRP